MKKYALGADIGGHHITTAAIDLSDATLLRDSICRTDVHAQGDAETILSAWAQALNTSAGIAGKNNIKGIGIAMPGPFDYPNGISLINDPSQKKFLALYNMNIKEALAGRTGISSENIHFRNDAECFLLGEVFSGAGKGSKRAIGVTLGTGFGSAYLFDNVSEDANLWCLPFRGGIAEDFISTRWFVKRYNELTGKTIKGVKAAADSYHQNEEAAQQLFAEFGHTLCEILAPLSIEHAADTIVLGGNISLASNLFIEPLRKALPDTRIVPAILNEEAALTGGASLLK